MPPFKTALTQFAVEVMVTGLLSLAIFPSLTALSDSEAQVYPHL